MKSRTRRPRVAVGARYGRLTVESLDPQRAKFGGRRWACVCDCGGTIVAAGGNLTSGNTKSCGCLNIEKMSERARTHGGSVDDPRLYSLWCGIKDRCYNPNNAAFLRYGGRGIYLDERWHDFAVFRADMGPRPTPRHSVERRDGAGPYSPENCHWATPTEQGRNTSRNRLVEYDGRRMPLVAACELAGVSYDRTKLRLREGLSDAEALSPDSRRTKRRDGNFVEVDGKTLCLTEAARRHGLSFECVQARMKRGWPKERWFEPVR